MPYKIFSSCIPIKGYNRSIIYDIQRFNYLLIPNYLYEIVNNDKLIDEIDDNSLSFLQKNELVFEIEKDQYKLFPKMDLSYDSPFLISNIIFEYNEDINNFEILNLINVKAISIVINNKIAFDLFMKNLDQHVLYFPHIVELIINFKDSKIITNSKILNRFSKISYYYYDENEINIYDQICVEYFKGSFYSRKLYGNQTFFTINLRYFLESLNYNPYFNQKIYITRDGSIKNSPECDVIFGNIYKDSHNEILNIINSKKIKKLWAVKKDNIDICRVCEYRNMCTDNRIPISRKKNEWYFDSECNYNPYISKWKGEEGYKKLAECNILSNKNGLVIDYDKIAVINKELWENN